MTNDVVWLDDVPDSQRWTFDQARFRVGDTVYVSTLKKGSGPPGLGIKKPPALIDATVALLQQNQATNIVELGISLGGSTALLAQIAQPRKLVALELSPDPIDALQSFIEANDYGETVRPYFGVDQADRARINEILDREFGDEPLDLVIDDASHLLAESRASFEVLFPRLRPGGAYIIEDWNWEHLNAETLHNELVQPTSPLQLEFTERLREVLSDPNSKQAAAFNAWLEQRGDGPDAPEVPAIATRPLTILVIELLLARAWSGDIVQDLLVQDLWVRVTRGPAHLDDGFRIADIVHDRFGLLPRAPS